MKKPRLWAGVFGFPSYSQTVRLEFLGFRRSSYRGVIFVSLQDLKVTTRLLPPNGKDSDVSLRSFA
jgi:hypothetical protein